MGNLDDEFKQVLHTWVAITIGVGTVVGILITLAVIGIISLIR
jgi:hypothetical protein